MSENTASGGDPCLWICFPCIFTWTLCEKSIQCCCMACCCITPEEVKPELNK